MIYTQKNSI